MSLDPEAREVLDQIAALVRPFNELPIREARKAFLALTAAAGETEGVAGVEDRCIPGPVDPIPIRIYTPEGHVPFPVMVFFHGGGWVIGNLDTHDRLCRQLTNVAGCVVVAVDYRLAPEYPFPAAPEDAYL